MDRPHMNRSAHWSRTQGASARVHGERDCFTLAIPPQPLHAVLRITA